MTTSARVTVGAGGVEAAPGWAQTGGGDQGTADTRPHPAGEVSPVLLDPRRMLVFKVAGRTRCCDLGDVREIVPILKATRLPGAPAFVRGIINLRGNLVTVIDAALCLYGVPADDSLASILLVERRGRMTGVVVDDVYDIQAVPVAEVESGALLDMRALIELALA